MKRLLVVALALTAPAGAQTIADFRAANVWATDIPGGSPTANAAPYSLFRLGDGFACGSCATLQADPDHPGLLRIDSGAAANSGYSIWTALFNGVRLAGGEFFETAIRIDNATNVSGRFGYHDSLSAAAVVDGVYLNLDSAGVLTGVTRDNGTESVTATSFSPSTGTWYRATVTLNADATLATFLLQDETGTTTLWTDTLATNIPTGAGRDLGVSHVWVATSGSARALVTIDYIYATTSRTLGR